MQILFFTDIHIHSHKQSLQRLQDCLDVLKWTLQTARERNIKDVLFLGDLFHDRQKIQVIAYHNTFKIFNEYKDLNIKLLLGNHDLWFYDKWDISSVMPLSALSNIEVIAEPTTLKVADINIDFLPFTHNPIEVLKYFKTKSKVLCGHVALDDAILNSLYSTMSEVSIENEKDVVKVDKEIFREWKKVFLGHYHCAQKLNDIVEYVGSPLQLNFNEAAQKKHIMILDTETLKTDYIENNFSPKHIIVHSEKALEENLDNAFVQIQVDDSEKIDCIDLRKKIQEKCKTNSLEFKEIKKKVKENHETLQNKFDLSQGDILERYVKISNTDLDAKLLLDIVKDLINEN